MKRFTQPAMAADHQHQTGRGMPAATMKTARTLFALGALALGSCAHAVTAIPNSLDEGFDDVGALAGDGWIMSNLSAPAGNDWFQGNDGVFAAQSGAASSYIGADFLSANNGSGAIDNWLMTPELSLNGQTRITFYTRTADAGFADQLEVRFGDGSAGPANFTTLVTTVGVGSAYPDSGWQQITATIDLSGSGRFAFRYVGDAAGADYIGIDSVHVAAVPEPDGFAMLGLGLAALGLARRRARKAV